MQSRHLILSICLAMLSVGITGAAEPSPDQTKIISVIQTFLDTDYTPVRRVTDMRRDMRQAIADREHTSIFSIVDPGRRIQTDAIDPKVGNAYHRLMLAGHAKDSAFVAYETWGFAPRLDLLIFRVRGDTALVVANMRIPDRPDSVEALKEMVLKIETDRNPDNARTTTFTRNPAPMKPCQSVIALTCLLLLTGCVTPKQDALITQPVASAAPPMGDARPAGHRITVGMPLDVAYATLLAHGAVETPLQVLGGSHHFHLPSGTALQLRSDPLQPSPTVQSIGITTYQPKSWDSKTDPERMKWFHSFQNVEAYDLSGESA